MQQQQEQQDAPPIAPITAVQAAPGRLSEAYDVQKAVGKGGYAVVYKGVRRQDGRIVAVKKVEVRRDQRALERVSAVLGCTMMVLVQCCTSRGGCGEHAGPCGMSNARRRHATHQARAPGACLHRMRTTSTRAGAATLPLTRRFSR